MGAEMVCPVCDGFGYWWSYDHTTEKREVGQCERCAGSGMIDLATPEP